MSEIHEILSDWQNVRVRMVGDLVAIAGSFDGVEHSGARVDGVSLALDLDRIARGGAKVEPTPEPTLEPEPAFEPDPEPVVEPEPEPTLQPEPELTPEPEPEYPPATPTKLSFEELTGGGIMLVEDELLIRRGLAWAAVSDHAEVLVGNLIDPNRRTEMIAEIAHIANKRQLGLPLTPSDMEAESAFAALQAREDEIRRFERQMREAVRYASLEMLKDFDVEGAGWPT
jgi:hypothetical protein